MILSSPSVVRLTPALCGIVATLLLLDLGRRLFGATGGLACGVVWVSTLFVVSEFRKAMADPYLATATLVAVWAWFVADTRFSVRLSMRALV